MRRLRARALEWTADLERDLDGSTTRIFVPSIMGAGLLVSLVVVLTDLGRSLTPGASRARREHRTQRRAVALVAPAADAVGVAAPAMPKVRRRLRARWTYVLVFMAMMALGLYVATGSTANYLRPGGYVEGVIWLLGLSLAVSTLFVIVAVTAFVIALWYPVPPSWTRALVDRTPLGARGL